MIPAHAINSSVPFGVSAGHTSHSVIVHNAPVAEPLATGRTPFLTVLIPTKNRQDSLDRLVRSIREQTYSEYEILIIDDGSLVPAVSTGPKTRIIRNVDSLGQCKARNQGFQQAQGGLIIHFDDDTELLRQDVFERIVNFANSHRDVAVIGLRQLKADRTPAPLQPSSSRVACYTAYFYGCAFLVRKDAIERIGGFNEWFGYYYDEMEFSMRALDGGYRIVYDPTLDVVHYEDPRGRDWVRICRLLSRNAAHTVLIRFPWWLVVPGLAHQLVRFIGISRRQGGIDWKGALWVAKETAASLLVVAKTRKALKFSTLKLYKKLQANPTAVEVAIQFAPAI